MANLTEAQKRVMGLIGKGWTARRSHGTVIEVNGKRVCNVDTLMALYRMGLRSRRKRAPKHAQSHAHVNRHWLARKAGTHKLQPLSIMALLE